METEVAGAVFVFLPTGEQVFLVQGIGDLGGVDFCVVFGRFFRKPVWLHQSKSLLDGFFTSLVVAALRFDLACNRLKVGQRNFRSTGIKLAELAADLPGVQVEDGGKLDSGGVKIEGLLAQIDFPLVGLAQQALSA